MEVLQICTIHNFPKNNVSNVHEISSMFFNVFKCSPFYPAHHLIPFFPGKEWLYCSRPGCTSLWNVRWNKNYFKPHPQILCNGLKQTFEVLLLSTTSVTKKILIVKKYNSCCRSHLWWYDTASCIVEGIAHLALEWTGWCRRCGTPEVI